MKHLYLRVIIGSVGLLLLGPSVSPTSAATKKKKPIATKPSAKQTAIAGKACKTAGERAKGTTLDCVQVDKTLLWHQ